MNFQHHVSSDKLLLSVGGGLFLLTILTAGVHFLHLPQPWSIIVAMVIAVFKAGLVALFFMGLYWDKKFNAMAFIFGILFVALLVGFTLFDTLFRLTPHPAF